jgi:hypothetical protein
MAIAVVLVQVPPGPVAKPRNRIVENITAIMMEKQRSTAEKKKSSSVEETKDFFLRVLQDPPRLCVAKIDSSMDDC